MTQSEHREKTALIIDDFAEMGMFVRDLCAASGYRASVHQDASVVDPALFGEVDVLFLDLSMPGVDGVQYMRQLGSAACRTPIVLISGHAPCVLAAAAGAGREAGVNVQGTLHKPFSIAQFEHTIKSVERAAAAADEDHDRVDEATLRDAIEANRIEPYFQPKIDLCRLEVVGFEALARLRLADGRVLAPEQFLTTAAECGLLNVLTDRMIILSLDAWREWANRGLDCAISVNIPVSRLDDMEFPDRIEELSELLSIDRRKLILEITETELLDNYGHAMDSLARLGMKRFSLAIDDFGTGFSSLMQLKRLPCVELKIDQSFIRDMHEDRHSEVIVRKSIEIGRELGLTVTAEGVESQADIDLLLAMECDLAQGYFISRPEPRAKITSTYIDGFAA